MRPAAGCRRAARARRCKQAAQGQREDGNRQACKAAAAAVGSAARLFLFEVGHPAPPIGFWLVKICSWNEAVRRVVRFDLGPPPLMLTELMSVRRGSA